MLNGMTYFRRFRMEIDLRTIELPLAYLPEGFVWNEWSPDLVQRHAETKFDSFREELDSQVFPCLGELEGCTRLMNEIAGQSSFLPEATWLISHQSFEDNLFHDVGTIQGLAHTSMVGAIQNVGVVPEHRGQGLGRALVLKCLHGFRGTGIPRVSLEVTANNHHAIELYKRVGFRIVRTMYRDAEPRAADVN
ncbi:MAG TPA: N-acetyltransferase [Planctomycetaceae bacterium]|nr:N-acetyltransferase [Planctomycetaceae bacterium]